MKNKIMLKESELYSLIENTIKRIVEEYHGDLNEYGEDLMMSMEDLGWEADHYVENFNGPIDTLEFKLHNVEGLCDLEMMRGQLYYEYINNNGISFDIDEPNSDDCDGILTIYC